MDRAYAVFNIKAVDEAGGKRVFKGMATTPTPDRAQDIMEPKGAQFRLPMPLLWQHDKEHPIGWVRSAKVNADGIPIDGEVISDAELMAAGAPQSLRDEIARAWALMKTKLVAGLSIGFKGIETADIKDSWGTRFLKWEWLELSAVTIPANAEATIHTIKSLDAKSTHPALGKSTGYRFRDHDSTHPGASGRSGPFDMKALSEQLKDLQDERAEKARRMQEIHEGCGGDSDSLNADDGVEFKTLKTDLRRIDERIDDVKAMQQAVGGAVAVTKEIGESAERGRTARSRIETPLKEKTLEKGIAYAQYVRLMYQAKGLPQVAFDMAQRRRGLDPRVAMTLKGDVEAGSVTGTTTAGNWGMELVGTETGVMADFLEFLRPQTIIGKFGAGGVPALSRIPFRVPFGAATAGGTAYWTPEGGAKPLTKFAFTRDHLEPLKITAMCAVTMELLRDSSPAADGLLRNLLGGAITERENIDFIDPGKTASAGVSPASITNGITPVAASGTGDADDVRTDVKAAFASFLSANNPPTTGVWVMSASTALSLSMMMNALGQPAFPGITMNGGTFAGLPVITSEYMPSVTAGPYVVLLNARDIFFNDLGGVQIDTSEHATLEMADNPGAVSTVPTAATGKQVSMFQTNSVAFRAEITLDWMRARDSAVYVISGVAWGNA